MSLTNAIGIYIKCSDFMKPVKEINDNTLFLNFNTELRSHDLYLILNFIYTKYKELIVNVDYLRQIENYVATFKSIDKYNTVFDNPTGIFQTTKYIELFDLCDKLEGIFYKKDPEIAKIVDIGDFLKNHDCSNIIVINKESYHNNQYVSYMKE